MKLYLVLISILCLIACNKNVMLRPISAPVPDIGINTSYSKADTLNNLIKQYTRIGIPGAAIAVYDAHEGWWESSAGYARIEDNTPMQPTHLHYLQSIAKTYTAVAILQLHEKGMIDFEAPITQYLPPEYAPYITGAAEITVRMLLNHTSGIKDYATDPTYTLDLIQHPLKKYRTAQLLAYIKGKPALFKPGSKYEYSNTNYELLALMIDRLTGDHARYFGEHIFTPLSLNHTFYRNDPGYLNYQALVNSYLDRYSNGLMENVSAWQITNVSNMIGDDGIVASPMDAIKFMRGIFEGQLISQNSLTDMLTWVKNGNGKDTYGMGIFHLDFDGVLGYGHGGAGIGSGCELDYIPSKNVYVFIATNMGTIVDGPVVDKANELKEKITKILAK